MQPSVGVAMKALAKLFHDAQDNNPGQDRLNPHDVLLGLSALFKKIAMASESNSTDELELGLRDSSSSRLGIIVASGGANLKLLRNLSICSLTQVALNPLILLIQWIPAPRTLLFNH